MIVATLAALLQTAAPPPAAAADPAPAVPLTRPVLIAGAMTADDYPADALRAEETGSVLVSFFISADGDASACRIERSSGVPALDEATCRIVERRYLLEPPRDPDGRPVEKRVRQTVEWTLP